MSLQETIYDNLVRKNENVKREYERYVMEHIAEHYESRFKHWKILWKLNWHYRVKKSDKPLLYWDNDVKPAIATNSPTSNSASVVKAKENISSANVVQQNNVTNANVSKKMVSLPYLEGAESRAERWISPPDLLRMLMNYDVISFDIFDTLLFRPFEKPQDMFFLLGEKLDTFKFYNIRKDAENHLRKIKQNTDGHRELYLDEIYQYIEKTTGIDAKIGQNTELELEQEFCSANPYMKYIFDTLIANGKRVILVSDMYIGEQEMKLLLENCGIIGYEKMFISCDYCCSKRDGKLFEIVKEYLNDTSIKMIHVGDNETSDIKVPESMGIETYWYKNVNSVGGKYRTNEITGLIGSAYRGIVNKHLHNGYVRYDAYYEYGYIYGGLFAVGYANYIHKYAKQIGAESILFVARDGYVLKKVYDYMFKDTHSDYILCSRISNLKMSAYKDKAGFLKEFVYRYINEKKSISIEDLFKNMNLESILDECQKVLALDQCLTQENLNRVLEVLESNWSKIIKVYEKEIEISKAYYKEFFENRKKVLIVDIGWRGQTIVALRNLEKDYWHFGCDIVGILAGSAPTQENLGQLTSKVIESYMFSPIKNRDCFDFHSKNCVNNILTELLVGAPCPSFKGVVSSEQGGYNLEFDVPEIKNYEYVGKIHQGIIDFAKEYVESFKNYSYMFEITGHDAYMPIKHIFKDYRFLKRFFKNYEFQDTVGGTTGNNSKTMRDIFNKFNL